MVGTGQPDSKRDQAVWRATGPKIETVSQLVILPCVLKMTLEILRVHGIKLNTTTKDQISPNICYDGSQILVLCPRLSLHNGALIPQIFQMACFGSSHFDHCSKLQVGIRP
jgi:hypothetical protein